MLLVIEKELNFRGASNAFPGAREKDQGSPSCCWWSLGYRLLATCMFWSLKNACGAPLHPCHEQVDKVNRHMIQYHDFSSFRFTLALYVGTLPLGVSYFVLFCCGRIPCALPFQSAKLSFVLLLLKFYIPCGTMWTYVDHVVSLSSNMFVTHPNWTCHITDSIDMSWPVPKCTVPTYEGALPSKKTVPANPLPPIMQFTL